MSDAAPPRRIRPQAFHTYLAARADPAAPGAYRCPTCAAEVDVVEVPPGIAGCEHAGDLEVLALLAVRGAERRLRPPSVYRARRMAPAGLCVVPARAAA